MVAVATDKIKKYDIYIGRELHTTFIHFKTRKHSALSFYQDNVKIQFTDTHVKVEEFATSRKKNKQRFNWIRPAEYNKIPTDCKYNNPRIKYYGLN